MEAFGTRSVSWSDICLERRVRLIFLLRRRNKGRLQQIGVDGHFGSARRCSAAGGLNHYIELLRGRGDAQAGSYLLREKACQRAGDSVLSLGLTSNIIISTSPTVARELLRLHWTFIEPWTRVPS
jgi:hypothetical protein